jgi:LysM repeat protein
VTTGIYKKIKGISKTAAMLETLRKIASEQTHTVAPGDMFLKLDKQYGLTSGSFQKANPSINPKRLRVGTKLTVPAKTPVYNKSFVPPPEPPPPPDLDKPADEHEMQHFYNAIVQAETGPYKDKWIRTHGVPGSSSTAWGPAQLTRKKLADYMNRYGDELREHQKFYNDTLLPMYNNFAKYGREPNKPGYDKRWEYGGYGVRLTPEQKAQYAKLVMDMMAIDKRKVAEQYPNASDNLRREKLIKRWRAVDRAKDPRYYKVIDGFYK